MRTRQCSTQQRARVQQNALEGGAQTVRERPRHTNKEMKRAGARSEEILYSTQNHTAAMGMAKRGMSRILRPNCVPKSAVECPGHGLSDA